MIVTNPFSPGSWTREQIDNVSGGCRGLTLAFGILETLIAFWLLERPGLTLVAAILAIGLWSMTYGVVQIVLAFEVKSLSARADTAAGDLGMVRRPSPTTPTRAPEGAVMP